MANRQVGTKGRNVAAGVAVAGMMGLGLLALPAGAGAQPQLPPVSAEDLVSSVLAAKPGAFAGTAELKNALGLPALPGAPQAANGNSTARIWSNGEGGGRVQLPTSSSERTLVSDGTTYWAWNSEDRKVVTGKRGDEQQGTPDAAATDPAKAATDALAKLRSTSEVTVDGTAEVAGRPAYELVLRPQPTERTLLREVRIAVDAEKRAPLRLTVLATGASEPALQAGFTELNYGAQDPALFTFTPPPGATVEERQPRAATPGQPTEADRTVVGEGWDTVVLAKRPAPDTATPAPGTEQNEAPDLSTLGTPVSGPWGKGRLITTAVGSAIVTDDNRVALGAVPEQVLTEALTR